MAGDGTAKVNVKKFMTNPLLGRKQMLVEVIHPGLPNVSKDKLRTILGERYKVDNTQTVVLFGFRTAFGGGRSKGFALIYDSLDDFNRYEPKYRKIRVGLLEKGQSTARKQIKELKNRRKKVRGTKKAEVGGGKK